jgi:hypothetical protein
MNAACAGLLQGIADHFAPPPPPPGGPPPGVEVLVDAVYREEGAAPVGSLEVRLWRGAGCLAPGFRVLAPLLRAIMVRGATAGAARRRGRRCARRGPAGRAGLHRRAAPPRTHLTPGLRRDAAPDF